MNIHTTIDHNRIIHVKGKPFFPICARHMPEGGTSVILEEAGFNTMRWTAFGVEGDTIKANSLPEDIGDLMIDAYIYNRGDLSRDAKSRSKDLSDFVMSVKDSPSLLCYEHLNEPSWTAGDRANPQGSSEGMAAGSEIIRSLDPDHPIHVGHMVCNLVSTLQKYNAAVDIVGCNPYVVSTPGSRGFFCLPDGRYVDCPDQTLSSVGKLTSKMVRVAQGLPVWMQLQAMSSENWYNDSYSLEVKGAGIYEHIRLYPSFWQMRFMAFNAIIRGATGLAWAMHKTPVDGNPWRDICKVIGELRDMHDVLAGLPWSGTLEIEYTEMGFSDWDGVEVLVKLYEGMPWILAANTQAEPMIATFSNLPEKVAGTLEVVNEARVVKVENGKFTDRFQPYEVHIYAASGEGLL